CKSSCPRKTASDYGKRPRRRNREEGLKLKAQSSKLKRKFQIPNFKTSLSRRQADRGRASDYGRLPPTTPGVWSLGVFLSFGFLALSWDRLDALTPCLPAPDRPPVRLFAERPLRPARRASR